MQLATLAEAYDSVASHGLVHRLDRDTPGASKRLDRGVKSVLHPRVAKQFQRKSIVSRGPDQDLFGGSDLDAAISLVL